MTDAKTLRDRHAAALNDAIEAALLGDARAILAAQARLASARAALVVAPVATSPFLNRPVRSFDEARRDRRGGGDDAA